MKVEVEHPQGMGKADLPQQLQLGLPPRPPLAMADSEGCPLADSVRGQDCGAAGRSGEEGRGRMRLVVLGEENLSARHAEEGGDDSLDPQLLPQRVPHRSGEAAPGAGKGPQGAGENPLELQHWLLVEDDRIELIGLEPAAFEAPLDRRQWKAGVVLSPREPLLLDGTDGHSVDQQGGCGVVIVGRDSENLHQY